MTITEARQKIESATGAMFCIEFSTWGNAGDPVAGWKIYGTGLTPGQSAFNGDTIDEVVASVLAAIPGERNAEQTKTIEDAATIALCSAQERTLAIVTP